MGEERPKPGGVAVRPGVRVRVCRGQHSGRTGRVIDPVAELRAAVLPGPVRDLVELAIAPGPGDAAVRLDGDAAVINAAVDDLIQLEITN